MPMTRRGRHALLLLALLGLPALSCAGAPSQDQALFASRRLELVRGIRLGGVRDSATLEALAAVPRHEFVPPAEQALAYVDEALPIECGQTISQPSLVASMTELIQPRRGLKVLEVGTGSGYQAAILARIGCRVYTIEIIAALATSARERLRRLGFGAVAVRQGDGYLGWPEEAPFDAILVTAGAEHVPPPLVAQLARPGRMVIPVGASEGIQSLLLVEKDARGRVRTQDLFPVRFVPLVRGRR